MPQGFVEEHWKAQNRRETHVSDCGLSLSLQEKSLQDFPGPFRNNA